MKFYHFLGTTCFLLLSEVSLLWGMFFFHDSDQSSWVCLNLLNETLCLKELDILAKNLKITFRLMRLCLALEKFEQVKWPHSYTNRRSSMHHRNR
jgi:hypothetical protein